MFIASSICNLFSVPITCLWNHSLVRSVAAPVAFCLLLIAPAFAQVAPLRVVGSQIRVGGRHTGLAGNSFFWSNQGYGAERFYNANVVDWLQKDWQSKIVRTAMGVEEFGGYISNPRENQARVEAVVDAAIARDMYVIIDWHSHHAENYQTQAVTFFREMAQTYGQHNNVIYEIYNEPIHVSWSNTVKPYAERVIKAIREFDDDNLIVVGSPTWSQDVHLAAADPITKYSNIAYALHFYAGTHKQSLRDRADRAMQSGIALMVTEWGTVNANGDGAVDFEETMAWVDWMAQNELTHLNWSVHDKQEGASTLRPGVSSNGNWAASELTQSGTFVRDIVRGYNADVAIGNTDTENSPAVDPSIVEAPVIAPPVAETPIAEPPVVAPPVVAPPVVAPPVIETPVTNSPAGEQLDCEMNIGNQWGTGFTGELTVTNNTSRTINGWEANLVFTDGSSISNGWNADFTGDNPYTASSLPWNSRISPGGRVTIGFQATKGRPNQRINASAVTCAAWEN